jgi:hypothetical protein
VAERPTKAMDEYRETVYTNMQRWRRVAELEHSKHCTARHDCRSAVEREYVAMLEAEFEAHNG